MSRRPVLVTGATGGIGMAAVRVLVNRGYTRSSRPRAATPPRWPARPRVRGVTMDVTDPEASPPRPSR
jgi:NAD(P)-dependent dehydrogenase (short-subunit alcohol dehydrogenase family)